MSRKRPAPGANPVGYPQQNQQFQSGYTNAPGPQLSNDQFFAWGQNAQVPDTYNGSSNYGSNTNGYPSQNNTSQSTQLTRRPVDQIVTRQNANNNQWGSEPSSVITPQDPSTTWTDDIDELVEKAQVAKRDAQSKRKQIPPFVLKLHR